jgi:hypothetical protein
MFYHKNANETDITKGLQIDEPMIFMPWDMHKRGFIRMFKDHNVSCIVKNNYFVKDVTIFGEKHCNIGVEFDKTIRKIGISRVYYDGTSWITNGYMKNNQYDYFRSFKDFQTAIIKKFGEPTTKTKNHDGFENCVWYVGDKIKISLYIMDRFGLAEYFYIEYGYTSYTLEELITPLIK